MLVELSKLLVNFIFAVLSFTMWKKHMILMAFWRWWKLFWHLSTKENQKNLCQDLLTIENTDSDWKVHALHYANAWAIAFQKLLQTRRTNRSNKKLCKRGFWLWLSIVWETRKLTLYQPGVKSFLTYLFSTEQSQKLTR